VNGRAPWVVLALAAILMVFVGVDRRELDGTTAFYAALSAQVADTGQLMPIQHGPAPYVLKPPLMFWGTAAVYEVFGVSPWTQTVLSRSFGILCIALVVLLTVFRDGPVYGRAHALTAGWWAAMVLLASTVFLENTTTMRLDTILLAGLLMSFVAVFATEGAWRPWVFYLGILLGTLGKGPPGLMPLALAPLLWERPYRIRWSWVVAALLLLPIPLWQLGLEHRLGTAFAELGADLAAGRWRGWGVWFESSFNHVIKRPLESSPHIAVLAFFAIRHAWGRWRDPATTSRDRRGMIVLLSWATLVVLATLVKPSQRLRYLLPALPVLAVLIGSWIAAKRPVWRPVSLPGAVVALAALTWIMPIGWWPPNHRSAAARTEMVAAVEAEVPADERIILIETLRSVRYGRQWAGRDWSYLHLRREVEALAPEEAAARGGRLALVHHQSFDRVPEELMADVIAGTAKARLVRIPVSVPGTGPTTP